MASAPEVYLNGRFVPYDEARVHVEDRGFLFADGVYEVVRAYEGRPFALDEHLARLEQSASAMRLPLPEPTRAIRSRVLEALARLGEPEATVYLQVTRGFAGPRQHGFPAAPKPTIFLIARRADPPPARLLEEGASLVSVPDRRWQLCHVKSTGLFLNSLARQEALDQGADDALFVRDGAVTECSSANFFAVWGGAIHTHPEGPFILSGVTRRHVIDLARKDGMTVIEAPFSLEEALAADEAFYTGTNSEVTPVCRIDGRPLGSGRPGPVTRRLSELYRAHVRTADVHV